MICVQLFIIGALMKACLTSITYELNMTKPMDRALNIVGISLAPGPVTTENNKTVDMVIALQSQTLYITNAVNYNPDIRYICNCVILRVDWVLDGIFVVSNRMVMLINPYNFRNITIINTDQNITYASYASRANRKFIAVTFDNRIQLFQNATSIYNRTTQNRTQTLTFDPLAYYLHFSDDTLHYTLSIQSLDVKSNLAIGVTVSIIAETQYKVLSLTANGYLSQWNQTALVFQKLLDSSLNKSKTHLVLTTGAQFLAVYAQDGLDGSLRLWKYENSQNVLLTYDKNMSFKNGIKSISSSNNKIGILNDVNEYKILARVQVQAAGINIWWIILPSSALLLIVVIAVIIKIKMRKNKPNIDQKQNNAEVGAKQEQKKEKIVDRMVDRIVERKGISKMEQKLIKGELEEQGINNVENVYAKMSGMNTSGSQQTSKTKPKKKYRLKQQDEEKSAKGKQIYYQFNSQIDQYIKVDGNS